MAGRVRERMTFANVVSCLALFVALGGTSYAALTITGKNVKNSSLTGKDVKNNSLTSSDVKNLTARDFRPGQLPAGPTGPAGPAGAPGPKGEAGAKGDPATSGVLDSSFVYQESTAILPVAWPESSQVHLLSSTDPEISDGMLQVSAPGQLHAVASVGAVRTSAGAGGDVACELRVSGKGISWNSSATFADAGSNPEGQPALPALVIPLVGSVNVEPGTYNVGVRCHADRENLAQMWKTDLHAVVYRR